VQELLSGNEAFARGAFEAGVTVATGYPGTPSTEILENLVAWKDQVYCEWSPNEKVALEVAAGACLAGARCLVTMKHVGLNVAADALMTLSYVGTAGGLVIVVADDPGMHSSQNEQDSRHFARFAKVPMLEPADSREAKEFVRVGLEISERFRVPVLLRTSTRISHSRGLVELGERVVPTREIKFEKDPPRRVAIPMWARQMRVAVEKRQAELRQYADTSELNRIEWGGRELGIVTHSVTYQYVKEAFPEASVLKLGLSYPFPDAKIREFAAGVKRVLVIEELDDILEEHIKSLGIACDGRNIVPGIGELTPVQLAEIRRGVGVSPALCVPLAGTAKDAPSSSPSRVGETPTGHAGRMPATHAGETPAPPPAPLPARPPVLCPGCPHRGVYYALAQHDVVVTGDIGCYSLGVMKPLSRLDTILCMGAGVSMAHGMHKAGEKRKVVGIVGDSTFFHSGITGLLDIVFNRGASTIFVVDNRTTAMTGHQDNPGTGRTLMGEPTHATSIEAVARACGVRRVRTINPYDLDATLKAVAEELACDEPSVVVSVAPCVLQERKMIGPRRAIVADACKACGLCLRLGCPAIEGGGKGVKPVVNELLCNGCGMCQQVCRFGAAKSVEVRP